MDIFDCLSRNRVSATNIPDHPGPGVYALFAKDLDCLPGINLPQNGLVYIGQTKNLASRNHFKEGNTGNHTLRASVGAILKTNLNLVAVPRSPRSSKYRYRFEGDGEKCLSQWMRCKLEYSACPFDGDVDGLKEQLISENKPPLNLNLWPNCQAGKIQALRKICWEEAQRNR